jgi:hypothetical protein
MFAWFIDQYQRCESVTTVTLGVRKHIVFAVHIGNASAVLVVVIPTVTAYVQTNCELHIHPNTKKITQKVSCTPVNKFLYKLT